MMRSFLNSAPAVSIPVLDGERPRPHRRAEVLHARQQLDLVCDRMGRRGRLFRSRHRSCGRAWVLQFVRAPIGSRTAWLTYRAGLVVGACVVVQRPRTCCLVNPSVRTLRADVDSDTIPLLTLPSPRPSNDRPQAGHFLPRCCGFTL